MIAVKNDRRTADNAIFDEIMQIFILLVEDGKIGLHWKVIEQVQQGQTRYADALLEHVYSKLLIEDKMSIYCLKKGNHVPVVVPDEKFAQRALSHQAS